MELHSKEYRGVVQKHYIIDLDFNVIPKKFDFYEYNNFIDSLKITNRISYPEYITRKAFYLHHFKYSINIYNRSNYSFTDNYKDIMESLFYGNPKKITKKGNIFYMQSGFIFKYYSDPLIDIYGYLGKIPNTIDSVQYLISDNTFQYLVLDYEFYINNKIFCNTLSRNLFNSRGINTIYVNNLQNKFKMKQINTNIDADSDMIKQGMINILKEEFKNG